MLKDLDKRKIGPLNEQIEEAETARNIGDQVSGLGGSTLNKNVPISARNTLHDQLKEQNIFSLDNSNYSQSKPRKSRFENISVRSGGQEEEAAQTGEF